MESLKNKSCTVFSILYVLLAYFTPFFWLMVSGENSPKYDILILAVPFFFGIIMAIFLKINFETITLNTLLRSSIIIKYALIPMYIVGGTLIAVLFLLTFTPIVIMIFIGPFMIAILSAYGYLTMLGGNAFSLAYIKKAKREGANGSFLSVVGTICQFFFSFDVISMAILALKQKKYIIATIAVIVLLFLGFVGGVIWLVVSILK